MVEDTGNKVNSDIVDGGVKRKRVNISKTNGTNENVPVFMDLSFESENLNDDNEDKDMPDECQNFEPAIDIAENKKVRNKFNWIEKSKWEDLDDVLDFLDSEGFVCYDDSQLTIGQKFYFRCKKTPKSPGPYCALRYIILYFYHR